MKRLNLGCGTDIKKGWINLDNSVLTGVDVKHNILKFPYPFKNNEFDYILASHILEHFYPEEITKIMNELHRIIKKDGILEIRVPYYNSPNNFQVLDHKTQFEFESFNQFRGKGFNCSLGKKEWQIFEKKGSPTFIGKLIPEIPIYRFSKINAIGFKDVRMITLRRFISYMIGNIYFEIYFKLRKA